MRKLLFLILFSTTAYAQFGLPAVNVTNDTIDWALGDMFIDTLTANIEYKFKNTSVRAEVGLFIMNDAAHTATFRDVTTWEGDTIPTSSLASRSVDLYRFRRAVGTIFGNTIQTFRLPASARDTIAPAAPVISIQSTGRNSISISIAKSIDAPDSGYAPKYEVKYSTSPISEAGGTGIGGTVTTGYARSYTGIIAAGGTSVTVTITGVDSNKSVVITKARANTDTTRFVSFRWQWVSPTSISLTRSSAGGLPDTIEVDVITDTSSINSQRIYTTYSNVTQQKFLTNSPMDLSKLFWLDARFAGPTSGSGWGSFGYIGVFPLSADTILCQSGGTAGATRLGTLQWATYDSCSAQWTRKRWTVGAVTEDITVNSHDTTKSYYILSNASQSTFMNRHGVWVRPTSLTNVRAQRNTAATNDSLYVGVVTFTDGGLGYRKYFTLGASDSRADQTITAITVARTFAFSTGGLYNSSSETAEATSKNQGMVSVTPVITTTTNVNLRRAVTGTATTGGFNIVQLGGIAAGGTDDTTSYTNATLHAIVYDSQVGISTSIIVEIPNLTAATPYFFTVKAIDDSMNYSDLSNCITDTTTADTPPADAVRWGNGHNENWAGDSNYTGAGAGAGANTPDRITTIKRTGTYGLLFKVNGKTTVGANYRTMLIPQPDTTAAWTVNAAPTIKDTIGFSWWWGGAIYIPSSDSFATRASTDNYAIDGDDRIVLQWQATPDATDLQINPNGEHVVSYRSPVLSLSINYGNWRITTRADTNATMLLRPWHSVNATVDKGGSFTHWNERYSAAIATGWTDWMFNYSFNWRAEGRLKVWKNSQIVLDLTGIRMGSNDTVGPYPSYGLYDWKFKGHAPSTINQPDTLSMVVWDNVRWGTSAADSTVVTPTK